MRVTDLQEFDFYIKHKSGHLHSNVDALSHLPCNDLTNFALHTVAEQESNTSITGMINVNPALSMYALQ